MENDPFQGGNLLDSARVLYESDSDEPVLYLSGVKFERPDLEIKMETAHSITSSHQQTTGSQDSSPSRIEYKTSKASYVRYSLDTWLAETEPMAHKLMADLELKKSTIAAQLELVSDLRMQISNLNDENAALKVQVAEKSRQLKELREGSMRRLEGDLSSMQRLYENEAKMVRRLEDREKSWQQEKERLERLTSELRGKMHHLEKRNFDLEQQLKMINRCQFDELDGNPGADNTLISELYRQLSNLREAVRKQSDVIRRLINRKSAERLPVVYNDIRKSPGIPESVAVYGQHDIEHRDHKDYNGDHHFLAYEEDTGTRCDIAYPPGVQKVSNLVMVDPQNRITTIERHPNGTGSQSPGIRRLRSCVMESSGDGQSGAVTGSASIREEDSNLTVRECPVCNALFPPEVPQRMLEEHVNAHFEPDFEVLSP